MDRNSEIKENVKQKYSQIARGEIKSIVSKSSCCCGGTSSFVDVSLKYDETDRTSIPDGADLGLGCGTPVAFADVAEGRTILDLGSGGGIDCFVAAKYVGIGGKVIGVDMTEAMIARANENKAKMNASNVEFRLGEIEALPVADNSVDRVISNCVINLVPNKETAFKEIFRVLKSGGKFTVSDIVVDGNISDKERHDASLWAGCISGALQRKDYLDIIRRTGFTNVTIMSEKKYEYRLDDSNAGLYSITVAATKR